MLVPFADRFFRRSKLAGAVSRAAGALVLALAALSAAPASAQMMRLDAIPLNTDRGELFGRPTYSVEAGPLAIKWRGIDDGFARDEDAIAHCRADAASCSPAAKRLVALIDEARGLTGRHRLAVINREINLSIAYTSDAAQFGSTDVWSSPVATFASGRGDCEDYAIAKMFTLRAAGIPAEDLRVLVARLRGGDTHAVLAVRNEGHWVILDNRSMVLVEDKEARDLHPLFAFDATGVHQFGGPLPVMSVAAKPADATPAAAPAAVATSLSELSMWF